MIRTLLFIYQNITAPGTGCDEISPSRFLQNLQVLGLDFNVTQNTYFFFSFHPLPDKRELLEIAKANAAKALGTDNIVLPASLKLSAPAREVKSEKQEREEAREPAEVGVDSPCTGNTSYTCLHGCGSALQFRLLNKSFSRSSALSWKQRGPVWGVGSLVSSTGDLFLWLVLLMGHFPWIPLICAFLNPGVSLPNLVNSVGLFFFLRLNLSAFLTVKSFSCATNCFPEIPYPSTQCILHTLFLSYRNHDYGSRHEEENLVVIKGLCGL